MKVCLTLITLCVLASTCYAAYTKGCYFSVAQSNGVWWFVDPAGKPFLSKGVDIVSPNGDSDSKGNRIFNDAVQAKYGTNYYKWQVDTVAQMKSWGLNTMGAWSSNIMFNSSLPFTVFLGFANNWKTASGTSYFFPDVFDAGFNTSAANTAKQISTYVNDPYLLGYFLDNELWWGDDWRAQFTFLAMFLNQTGAGFARAQSFLKSRYSNTIGNLNKAWGINAPSFENLKSVTYNRSNPNYIKDSADFQGITAEQYFSVSAAAIRAIDPYHLILGAKHISIPAAPVLAAEGKYSNVYSFDAYNTAVQLSWMQSAYDRTGGLPSIIAEFAFRANDSGLPNTKGGGGTPVYATQTQRANQYQTYVQGAYASPYLIGTHWFQWSDQPAGGRNQDGENSNLGVVNGSNIPYTALVNKMAAVNPGLDAIHGTPPASFPAKCYALICPKNCNGHGCCDTTTGTCTCDSDYTGLACDTYVGGFTDTFPSFPLTYWANMSSYPNGRIYLDQRVLSKNSNGLLIPITNTGCPSLCGSEQAVSVGLKSRTTYEYGRFDFTLKFANTVSIAFTITWQSDGFRSGDGLQIAIYPDTSKMVIQRWKDSGSYTWTQVTLPSSPTSDFHTYSMVKNKPTDPDNAEFSLYQDSTLLATYTTAVPVAAGTIQMTYYADPLPATFTTNVQIKSIKYTPAAVVVAQCATPKPTTAPTTKPTNAPTTKPTSAPTAAPTSAPTTSPTAAPPTATTPPTRAWIQVASTGEFVYLDSSKYLLASQAQISSATTFDFAKDLYGYGTWNIINEATSLYTRISSSIGGPLIADTTSPSTWESFILVNNGGWSIWSYAARRYVDILSNDRLSATLAAPSSTKFNLFTPVPDITAASTVRFISKATSQQLFVNSSNYATAVDVTLTRSTKLKLTYLSSGKFTIQGSDSGLYASADQNLGPSVPLVVNRATASTWEQYTIAETATDEYTILASSNSKYLTVQSNGMITASATSASSTSSIFYVINA